MQTDNIQTVTLQEVHNLLELGRLLFSVLTPEEIEELQDKTNHLRAGPDSPLFEIIGNAGDS